MKQDVVTQNALASVTDFKAAMRRVVSSVCLITTVENGQRFGLIATAISSVTADPPSILVCINRSTSIHDPLKRSGIFCVNMLGINDIELSKAFSNSALRESRFKTGNWHTLRTGSPALTDAAACFDCRSTEFVDASTHTIVIGRVEAVYMSGNDAPLAYMNGQFGSFTPIER